MLRLRRLPNSEFDHAEELAAQTTVPLDTCPTCSAKLIEGEWEGGQTYRLDGEEHDCNCHDQYTLRMHYLLASIPDQYYTLNFETDYNRSDDVKSAVANYLGKWQRAGYMGIGLMFRSKGLGTGKTFAAAHVAKELVKHKQRVHFTSFRDLVDTIEGSYEASDPYRGVTYLVIDEVFPGWSEKSGNVFADSFEQVIRHRNHNALPTILTTNLTQAEFDAAYPRIASLLMPTMIEIEMPGGDFRDNDYALQNLALMANGEVKPIS